jgi:hypothetical protein
MDFGNCEDRTEQSVIVIKENRSRLVINNPRRERIRKILVDGCVITNGLRCDYFIIGPKNAEYFVELKGCDIEHAIHQLETTIQALGVKNQKVIRHSIIISSRCPLISTRIQKLTLYFKKNLMSTLKIKCNCLEIEI